jgi:DNA-binding transcriptional regulator YdaS (Cro superfamily)
MKDEALKRAIKKAGNSQKLAEGLGIKPQAVSQWTQIPLGRVFDVERVTGIPHQELRPDFFCKEAAE